jgi:hypothetical protein
MRHGLPRLVGRPRRRGPTLIGVLIWVGLRLILELLMLLPMAERRLRGQVAAERGRARARDATPRMGP